MIMTFGRSVSSEPFVTAVVQRATSLAGTTAMALRDEQPAMTMSSRPKHKGSYM